MDVGLTAKHDACALFHKQACCRRAYACEKRTQSSPGLVLPLEIGIFLLVTTPFNGALYLPHEVTTRALACNSW